MTRARAIDDPFTGQHLTFIETGDDTHGDMLRAEVLLDPGGFVPRHLHLRQDETLEVLAGSVRYRTRGDDRVMRVGDRVVVRRHRVHRVANAGSEDARFVLEVRPARHIEQTMRSMFTIGRVLGPLAKLRRRAASRIRRAT
jgi:quercetin dioxygenase-like cupin family protein